MDSLVVTVAGVGMINPVGVGAPATLAAVRAGINQYSDSSIVRASGEPYKMASIPNECLPALNSDDPESKQRLHNNALYRRILQLGKLALTEACEIANIEQMIPVFLAVPEQRCGRPFPALEPIIKDLFQEIDYPLDLLTSRVFPLGRAGGMNALSEAMELLLTTPIESIIVGGIDSYMDVMLLSALGAEQRLLSIETAGGFAPGEGAAFIVLTKTPEAGLVVFSPGIAQEPGHMYSEEVCIGDGLSTALKDAVLNAGESVANMPIQTVFCSMNGEPANGKEWGASMVRNSEALSDSLDMQHPAECYGDLGAATVPTLVGLASLGLEKECYQGPLLVWGASDREQRGAVVMSLNKESENG
ncbi:MAG: 3-oxoacyl-[acyl-carrier-protein] synthase-1 [Pseudohongiellaceae bacterium]